MVAPIRRLDRHQVAIYLGAIAAGAVVAQLAPTSAGDLERAINPILGALLYVTFLQVPATELARSLRDVRFTGAILVVNFAVVPLVVTGMFSLLPADQAVRVGVLLVLLTPCVDYVIVFCGLAGGSSRRLLAATPLLLLLQMFVLPLFLVLFLGPELADIVDVGPFVEAFLLLIVLPLSLAWFTQALATRHRAVAVGTKVMGSAMVPLMALTLLVVVGSQLPALDGNYATVARVVPFYVTFLLVMVPAGWAVGRLFRLEPPDGRAILFSGSTRNSLVVLPLALALPDGFGTATVVIVSQTLVELVGMVICVRVVPRLLPRRPPV